MKAKVFGLDGPGKLITREISLEKPGKGELLLKITHCGICSGEIAAFRGDEPGWTQGHLGHEPVCIVEEVGPEVKGFEPGDRVAALAQPAYTTHALAADKWVHKLPKNLTDYAPYISEPASCAVNGALRLAPAVGSSVAQWGAGYMGLLLLQAIPKTHLLDYIVIDLDDTRLEMAKKFGATRVINASKDNPVEAIRDLYPNGVEIAVEASGSPKAAAQATKSLRASGTLGLFGWLHGEPPVPAGAWHLLGATVLNLAPMTLRYAEQRMESFHAAVELLSRGVIDQKSLISHRFPLESAREALECGAGRADGWIKGVLVMDGK